MLRASVKPPFNERREVPEEADRLAKIEDHTERIRVASEVLAKLQADMTEAARLRRESIAWLREHGYSLAAIADLIGVSRARIAQLREAGPPPERAFLGTDTLTIAIPLKAGEDPDIALKPAEERKRPVVSQEDVAASNELVELARDLQLGATIEYIPTSGKVDLNRNNLIVICGPKISATIAEALTADPVLHFDSDEHGRWFLVDQRSGQTYRSPSDDLDNPRPEDVAYLSRIPRPDGQGTFILLTGMHAVGSHGVIRYLGRELPELYRQVGTYRFSTVIACVFDLVTRSILSSRRVTPLYLHEGA